MPCHHLPSVSCPECSNTWTTPIIQPAVQPSVFPIGPNPVSIPATGWPTQTPHKCPVCEGTGSVPEDFYPDPPVLSYMRPNICRSCWGQGVIWR